MDWIDLTQTISNNMPGVHLTIAKELNIDGWNAKNLNIYSHAGTHVDAPVHFGIPGLTVDQFSFDQLIGFTKIWDLSGIKPGSEILPDALGNLKNDFKTGDSLIIKTGWSKYSDSDPDTYRNKLPRIGVKLANWLVEKKVKILAVESPSVANVNDLEEVTLIHQILFSGQIIIVEGICNLDSIEGDSVELMVIPLKIKDGDGAPARVMARPLKENLMK